MGRLIGLAAVALVLGVVAGLLARPVLPPAVLGILPGTCADVREEFAALARDPDEPPEEMHLSEEGVRPPAYAAARRELALDHPNCFNGTEMEAIRVEEEQLREQPDPVD
jgi:hypothetical protein